MTTKLVQEKSEWESLIKKFSEANFLQSWNWGVFHQNLGKTVVRVLAEENKKVALAQLVIEPAKRGRYAAVAGGPLMDWQDTIFVEKVFAAIVQIAKEEGCIFLRFRPQTLESDVQESVLKKIGAQLAPMHLTADLTLQLDISQSEDELLSQMRKNTRYEVKKAQKLGISTKVTTNPSEIHDFYLQQLAVAKRHNFVPFSEKFLTEQFLAFLKDDAVALISSYYQDKLLATAFVIFYNREAVYHYGVSTEDNARLPGAYATQWAAVIEAKRRGCSSYNFWGVAPEGNSTHRFAGVSLFKRGFGGKEVAYLPAHDIAISFAYWIPWVLEIIRKKLRRL